LPSAQAAGIVRVSADTVLQRVCLYNNKGEQALIFKGSGGRRRCRMTYEEEISFLRVKQNFETTGLLDEVEEINSYSYYTKKLNSVLQTPLDGQDEATLAANGYGHLRSAIEITVEDDLFKKTIKRYKKGVAFPSLLRVNGGKIDEHKSKLNDIYEKCCVSIDGHSSPEEIHTTPTMSELNSDFESFKKIRSEFTK